MVLLWISAGALAWLALPQPPAAFVCGACVVLAGLTSPLAGLLGALILAAAMSLGRGEPGAMQVVGCALGGCLAGLVCFSLYPFSLMEWMQGVWRHSRINLGLPAFQGFAFTWLTRPHLPLLFVTFLALALPAVAAVWVASRSVRRRRAVVAWISLIVFAVILGRFSLVKSEAAYNAVVWLPLFAAVVLHHTERRATVWLVVAAMTLPVLGLARSSVLLGQQIGAGPSYADVRFWAARFLDQGLAMSPGLFLASPDLRKTNFRSAPEAGESGSKWFIDQQLASGRGEPKSYEGYELVRSTFAGPLEILGIPLSRAPTGWQYAVYRRLEPAPLITPSSPPAEN